jgi:hypothetical protein
MAQIDPNIALGFRMPQIQDPVAATARVQEIGVNALKMQELQRGMQEEQEVRNFLRGADLSKPETRAGLAKFGKTGLGYSKLLAEQERAGLETKKLGGEITKQQLEQSRERTSDLAFNPSDNNIKAYLEDSILRKEMTPEQAQGLFAQVANMPIDQRRQTFLQLGASAAKRLEQMTISAAQQQTADVTRRGQDISATTTRRGQDKPVFSADYGGFVVPPSANAPQGSFIPVTGPTGAPLESSKPLTEGQAKGVGFALRAREADQVLNTIGKKGEVQPGLIKRTLESTPFIGEGLGTMANVTQSAAQQQVEQAQRNFVNAVLRQESGAVINEDEFNNAKKQYFPQPGDSDKVIKQKEQARKTTIKALETQAGPGLRRAGGGKAEDPLGIR